MTSRRRRVAGMAAQPSDPHFRLVRTVGLEPTRPVGQEILSLQRLPFRHVRACADVTGGQLHVNGCPGESRGAQTFKRSRISLPGLK